MALFGVKTRAPNGDRALGSSYTTPCFRRAGEAVFVAAGKISISTGLLTTRTGAPVPPIGLTVWATRTVHFPVDVPKDAEVTIKYAVRYTW